MRYTTRKPEKSNGITDGNIPSVIYTDGHNSVSKSVGIYRRNHFVGDAVGIYRRNISVGIYRRFHRRNIQFVWKYATAWWRQAILPTESTKRFKLRLPYSDVALSPTASPTEGIRRWFRRKKPLYAPICRHSHPLFLLLLLSHPTSPLPNSSQTAAKHPSQTLHYSQHEHSSFLYPFLVDFIIFL